MTSITMSSYSYVKSIEDPGALSSYVVNTLPSLQKLAYDGANVVFTFSSALTAGDQTVLVGLLTSFPNPSKQKQGNPPNAQSLLNSSAAALAANAVFTGSYEDVSDFAAAAISVLANVSGTLTVQFGATGKQNDRTVTYTVPAATATVHVEMLFERYIRVLYTNGPTAQTSFRLQTMFRGTASGSIVTGSQIVDDQSNYTLTRSAIAGRRDIATYGPVRMSEEGFLRVDLPKTMTRTRVTEQVSIVQGSFSYNLIQTEQFDTAIAGSGTATVASRLLSLSSGAAATSSASLSSKRRVRARPGQSVQIYLSVQFGTPAVGNTQLAGVGDSSDGIFVGYSGVTFGVLQRVSGTDTWTPSTSFNVDKLDGTGSSAMTLVPTRGNTYLVTYHGGYGSAIFQALSDQYADYVTFHRIISANVPASALLVSNPSMPVIFSSQNVTNATAVTLKVSTFAALLDGTVMYNGTNRSVESIRYVNGSSYTPLLSLQNSNTWNSVNNQSSAVLKSLALSCDGNRNLTVCLLNAVGSVAGGAFTDVSTNNSFLQQNTACTSYSGGVMTFAATCAQQGSAVFDLQAYDLTLEPGATLVVAARGPPPSVFQTTVHCVLSWVE